MKLTCPFSAINQGSENTQSFSKENLALLQDAMYEQFYPKGSTVFWEGDESDKLFFIKNGVVKLTKTTDDGKDLVLFHFQTGDMFGELEDHNHMVYSFNAEAIADCTVGIIQQRDLETLLWQHGDLAIQFMKWMGYMQRFTQSKLRDLMFFGKNGALASTLIRMANPYGIQDGSKVRFATKFTNTELAELIGATRETVNRMLNQLKKDKIIDYENGSIVILNLDHLKGVCHCDGCPKDICRL
ncbi:Crp/Fnr family transcriptional regulator [Pseudalkalibacillus caeni]|uniref:Crp/Fnr family transcriptional regulator n=1 Tax=Exobacillus caeni TaxID=2574798 RepID=A0A5R9F7H3_9BACL|nr:Crp/Fnr family transcriptional regulator [Pseudalkalibacillus caeni]TLS38981.1 Crp/Fnr family transcriptional regulator [Pseudalkalibacillus caeni]